MSDPTRADFYARLGADQTMGPTEIKRVVREAQKRYHPDHNDHPESRRQFDRVMTAADCLCDPTERAAYDVFRERFGAADAARAYERWTTRGRFQRPERFTPGFASTTEQRAGTGNRTETEANTAHSTATGSTASSERHRSASTASGTGQSTGQETDRSHRTHANFGHRQSYDRQVYEPPPASSLGRWARLEGGLLLREMASLLALGLAAVAGLVATTVLGFVLVLGVYVLGTVVAVLESIVRTAGLTRFDAYLVTEIGLTWLLEVCVYLATLLAALVLFSLLFDREWADHLGNRIRLPQRILLTPAAVVAGVTIWLGQRGSVQALLLDLDPDVGLVVIGTAWLGLHRATLLLRETPPNHTGESYLDSVGWLLFQVGTSSSLLALYLLGGQALVGSLAEATEYTLLLQHLSPSLLVGGIVFGAICSAGLGLSAALFAGMRRVTVSTEG